MIWPYYLKNAYGYVSPEHRYPHFIGIRYFTEFQVPILLGLGACLAAAGWGAFGYRTNALSGPSPGKSTSFPYPLLLPPLYYLVAAVLLFKHMWHFTEYGIYASLGVALIFCVFGKAVERTALILLLPYIVIFSAGWVKDVSGVRSPAPVADLVTPSGYILAGPVELVNFYTKLFTVLGDKTKDAEPRASIVVLTQRPGIYFFSGREVAGRYCWYFNNYIRPWEEKSETDAIANASAVVIAFPAQSRLTQGVDQKDIQMALEAVLPYSMCETLAPRLTSPVFVGTDTSFPTEVWLFSISRPALKRDAK